MEEYLMHSLKLNVGPIKSNTFIYNEYIFMFPQNVG